MERSWLAQNKRDIKGEKEKHRTQNNFGFFSSKKQEPKWLPLQYLVLWINFHTPSLSHNTRGNQTNKPSKNMEKKKNWLKVDGGIKGVDDISQDQSQQHQYVCNTLVYGCTCNKIRSIKVGSFFFIDNIHQSNMIDIS